MIDRTVFRFRLPRMKHLPVASLLVVAAAVAVMFFPTLADQFQYDRAAIAAGELWRIVTCHLTHWSVDHLFWDATVLLVLGFLVERESRRALLACLGVSAVVIPICVWFCLPDLATYRGLSGIDSAVFLLLAVMLLRASLAADDRVWAMVTAAVVAGFVAKIGYEFATGATLFVDSTAAQMLPVPAAHVVGAILGAACGIRAKSFGV